MGLVVIIGCSGGSKSGPAPQQASQLTLVATPNPIVFASSSDLAGPVTTVGLMIANWESQTELYFSAYSATGIVDDVTFYTPDDSTEVTTTVSFQSAWWLGLGTYSDTLRFVVSTDQAGNDQISGSPLDVPVTYNVGGVANITSISPSAVVAGGPSFSLTLNGSGFSSDSQVYLETSDSAGPLEIPLSPLSVTPTRMTLTVPAYLIATPGDNWISYQAFSSGAEQSNSFDLRVLASSASAPAISPVSAVAGGPGFTLTYTAPTMMANPTLEWNGMLLSTNGISATEVKAEVPASAIATAGTATIYLTNSANGAPMVYASCDGGIAFPILPAGTDSPTAPIASPTRQLTLPVRVRRPGAGWSAANSPTPR
jgi:hypothetical protein